MNEPVNGKEVAAVSQPGQNTLPSPSEEGHAAGAATPQDEAARLAEAQVERLAKKSAENVKAVLGAGAEPAAPPQVKLVGSLSIQLFDNGQASINMPVKDYDMTLELIRMLQVAMIRQARNDGIEMERTKKKVPFMKRVFQRGANKVG